MVKECLGVLLLLAFSTATVVIVVVLGGTKKHFESNLVERS
jgi:hypothetical protein